MTQQVDRHTQLRCPSCHFHYLDVTDIGDGRRVVLECSGAAADPPRCTYWTSMPAERVESWRLQAVA